MNMVTETEKRIIDKHVDALYDESIEVAENMERHGGNFVKALGAALRHADLFNTRKIRETWPAYWQQYKKWGE